VDPRQRSSDRRFFKAIGIWMLIGLVPIALGLVLAYAGADMWESGYRQPPLGFLFPIGGVFLATGVWSLVRRAVRGPEKPGKRASS
jgi:hypothetical protein